MPGYQVSPRLSLPLTHLAGGACAAWAFTAAGLLGAAPLAPNPVMAMPPSTPTAPIAMAARTPLINFPLRRLDPDEASIHPARRAVKRSRRTNFCTLPEPVIGKTSTNSQWIGVLWG